MTRRPYWTIAFACLAPFVAAASPGQPSDWTEGYVEANEIRIHYWRTGGDKPPLVMLHGFSDDGLCWTTIARELADRYDVILPDARAHGLSDRQDVEDPADAQVEDIAGLITGLKLDNPIIVGHSMGSASAAWFAARYPKIPRAVVLVDPRLVSRPPAESSNRASPDYIERRATSILQRNNTPYETLFDAQMAKFPHWGLTELHFWVISKQRHHPSAAYLYDDKRPDMAAVFPDITAPTLILKADDPDDLKSKNAKVAALLQTGTLVHVKDAGHSVHRDQKERFLSELNAFLNQL